MFASMRSFCFFSLCLVLFFGCSSSKNVVVSPPDWFAEGEKNRNSTTLFYTVSAENISEEKAIQSARVKAGDELTQLLFREAYERTVKIFVEEMSTLYVGYNPEGLAALRRQNYPKMLLEYIDIAQNEVKVSADGGLFTAYVTFSYPLLIAREQVMKSLSSDQEWGIAFKNSESFKVFEREYPYLKF